MKAAIARGLHGRGWEAVLVGAAMLIAAVAGVYGVGHPKRALGLGAVVLSGGLLMAWMRRGDVSTRAFRWIPLAWISLLLVTDLRFSEQGPLETVSGDIGIQHVIQLCLYGSIVGLIIRSRAAMLALYPRPVPKGLMVAWPVMAAASSLWSLTPLFSLAKALQLLVLAGLALFVVRVWLSDPVAGERIWGATMRLFVQVVSLLAVIGFLFQPWTSSDVAGNRFTWPGAHPGVAATYLGLALLILVIGGRRATRFSLFAYWLQLGLFIVTIYMAQTRSVIGATLLGVGVGLWFRGRQKPIARYLGLWYYVLGIGLTVIIAAQQLATYLSRGETIQQITTLTGRVPLWQFAVGKLDTASEWLVGFGYFGATRVLVYPEIRWAGSAHSSWVELLLGVGLIGLCLAAADIVVLVARLAKSVPFGGPALISIAIVTYLVITSFVSESLVAPGVGFGILALAHVPSLAQRGSQTMGGSDLRASASR